MDDAQRLIKTYEMQVPASPEEVFPLLCPVREREWLPYWNCQIVHSISGLAEADCVFTTDLPDRGRMIWVVSRYDPPQHVQYTVFKPASHTWNLSIRVTPASSGSSVLAWKHVFTGLTNAGNLYLLGYTEDHHRQHLKKIERHLIHFLETGEMLKENMANNSVEDIGANRAESSR